MHQGLSIPFVVRPLPWCEPETAFARLSHLPHPCWLDSGDLPGERARFSFLAVDPFRTGQASENPEDDPFTPLAELLSGLPCLHPPSPFPFAGGLIGTLGYPLRCRLERLPARHPNEAGIPDLWAGAYDLVLAWDHDERRCVLFSSGLPEISPRERFNRAGARADWLLLQLDRPTPPVSSLPPVSWRADLSPDEYEIAVARCIALIERGELFQANITQRFMADRPPGIDPVSVQRVLHHASPAPFAAYIGWTADTALISASPERFLRLEADGRVETRPIKGTRPRGANPEADRAEGLALLASDKDRAENLMIVDLMRNDLARVSDPGQVRVPLLCALESFPAVHHLVSAVTTRLRPGLGALDLLRATFPGGSVTGAPKIRAMEVIDALEASDRGSYCGSVFWLGLDGALDSSIVIRSLVVAPGRLLVGAGGGITADSSPAAEEAEMQLKAAVLLSLFPSP